MQIGCTWKQPHSDTHTDTTCANPHTPADTHDTQQQQQQAHQRMEIAMKLLALLIRSVCQSRNLLDRLTDRQTDRHPETPKSWAHTSTYIWPKPHFRILPLQRISHNNKFASRQGKRRRGGGKAERLMAKAKHRIIKGWKVQLTKWEWKVRQGCVFATFPFLFSLAYFSMAFLCGGTHFINWAEIRKYMQV